MAQASGQAVAEEVSDTVLVTAVRAGDIDAFDLLYRRHAPGVRHAVAAVVRDAYRVEDAVQDAFVRALERIGDLREPERLAPWLKSIARNAATDGLRARSTSDLDDVPEGRLEDSALSTDELTEIRELASLVQGTLAELAPRDATALAMAGYLDASPAEIAAELGVSSGAAKVALHRARGRLRTALKIKVLVRSRAGGCVEFADHVADGAYTVAARHVAVCVPCQRAGSVALRLYAPEPETQTGPVAMIELHDGLGTRTIALRDELWVGRECAGVDTGRTLLIDDPDVSRTHLHLEFDGRTGQLRATDVSRNGTLLNGSEMAAQVPITLRDGDALQVSRARMTVRLIEPSVGLEPGGLAGQPPTASPAGRPNVLTRWLSIPAVTMRVSSADDVPVESVSRLAAAARLFGALADPVQDAVLIVRWSAGEPSDEIEHRRRGFVDFSELLGRRIGARFVFETQARGALG